MLTITASGKVEANNSKKLTQGDQYLNTNLLTTDDSNSHRALIFCQIKKYMYMIEKEILKKFNIPYLLLDATLNPKERFETAEKFNNHPKYKILLLSTNIGSLGLNLTGADTVIFMEHDWNPMKDLQAIDRAHRIGQTKTVTVYRLISMGTLEEKIMNLQRFKKKLHRMLITEKITTGTGGKDEEEKVEVENILKSFENQDAFKKEMDKNISSATGIQVDEDEKGNEE
jgi:TATA-binding protein-associated factor